jgi:ribose transport system ATP-binding protein
MISSDMEEMIGVSDRVAVMHEGRIAGILERAQVNEPNILRLATGQQLEDSPAGRTGTATTGAEAA